MKLNKKGFTLVEILAAVAILSILMGTAIISVSHIQEKSRKNAYEAMETSSYVAAQNYIQKKNIVIAEGTKFSDTLSVSEINSILSLPDDRITKIPTDFLVDRGMLEKLKDPKTKSDSCSGTIYVTKQKGSGAKLDSYSYLVEIKCPDYISKHKVKGTDETARGVIFLS